ncbi:putative ATPase (AAA+ superfamily) [Treponema sp. JC4]|uniref:ATP-binding protein n=1 Tax=Treponema sp. JC4 TaxID=1124982 RepID=UPI00025B0CC9|nr:ATP-binding protein [Treponema sp. JC4]EID84146.1 putative ATPase (AAA+ superfamily) [Treponema sp. JC4]
MKRKALEQLLEWKNSSRRKPLILKGARQVGKTWLMKEFGRLNYEKTFYFSFEKEEELFSIFEKNKDPYRIIEQLGLIYDDKIEGEKHLIIFDEIQECPNALNSLKYFNEEANEYHIIAAGSLLGTLLADSMTYPVGKVNLLDIYPMDFEEFLGAVQPGLLKYIEQTRPNDILEIQHTKLIEQYHNYLIVGGMPECVSCWVSEKNSGTVAQIQKELITLYENDFAKHNKKVNAARILLVFRSLVSQLSKENEKFIYGCVKSGARAREFEESIEWLVSSGIVLRIFDVTKPEHPLKAFEDLSSFKLFFFDVGLLKYAAGVPNKDIILNTGFQFKGPLTENYCLQQLIPQFDINPHYYSPAQNYEVDFLLQNESDIIPVECKAGKNTLSASFKRYRKEQKPNLAVRFSELPYKEQDGMVNVPLYLAGRIKRL